MGTATVDPTLLEQRDALLKQIRDVAAKADDAGRDFTDDEYTDVTAKVAEFKNLNDRIRKAEDGAKLRDQITAITNPDDVKAINDVALAGASVGGQPLIPGQRRKSAGELFTESDAYKAFRKAHPNGVSDRSRVNVEPVHMPGGVKALITGASDTSAGAMVVPDRAAMPPVLYPPLTLRDVITIGQTTSDSVEYAQVDTRTNAAAVVPEATTSAGGTANVTTGVIDLPAGSGVKPESALTLRKVTAPVRTLAHWLPITKRAMSDAAQIRTYIDQFLRDGLDRATEAEAVSGDGTGEHFTGVLNTTGTQAQAFDTDVFVTVRKAMTKVRSIGGMVTGVLISPQDDEVVDLARDGQNRFFGAGPFAFGPSTLWGVPRVVCYSLPAGTAIVGDLRTMVLWDREQASVSVSDSHADFFVRNLLAILAEMRAAFGVLQPSTLAITDVAA